MLALDLNSNKETVEATPPPQKMRVTTSDPVARYDARGLTRRVARRPKGLEDIMVATTLQL
jgi:hypothetical protein